MELKLAPGDFNSLPVDALGSIGTKPKCRVGDLIGSDQTLMAIGLNHNCH